MCGRYTLYSDKKTVEQQFGVTVEDDGLLEPDYNVAPGSVRPVVLTHRTSDRVMGALKWGLVPPFVKNTSEWKPLINARSETVDEKPSFKKAFQRKRCVVPANGFYEWKDFGGGKKIPFYIRLLDQELFGMAGIYETHTDSEGNEQHTFAILTTQANALMQPLHDRMPVILREDDYSIWLDPVKPQPEMLKSLLQPYPMEEMSTYKVSTDVNNASNNGAELINPRMR
ncbi:SOS response-associated peptidase [Natronogracilivirga saccharolytica]|uniref:Abasic site processing protein n=1 Tax=Natronogracilivirga saccharolytica TaxID=2812953 RepID=A0A8J7UWF2_9BACT|nr:SOS response-associated peptidase [Natronogracilivirga saccharolytica]MBP3193562.1 SOS response-associated peptidase [Natronogracilivirga saccharolytica]